MMAMFRIKLSDFLYRGAAGHRTGPALMPYAGHREFRDVRNSLLFKDGTDGDGKIYQPEGSYTIAARLFSGNLQSRYRESQICE